MMLTEDQKIAAKRTVKYNPKIKLSAINQAKKLLSASHDDSVSGQPKEKTTGRH